MFQAMTVNQPCAISSSDEAAFLLADKLSYLRDSDSIVIGVSSDSLAVSYNVAQLLNLPFDLRPCRAVKHPGVPGRTIGSVGEDEVLISEKLADIPRNYIYHQIILIRNALKAQETKFAQRSNRPTVEGKTVIIVTNVLITPDSVMATISAVRKQNPKEIIIAAVAGTPNAMARLLASAEDVMVLNVDNAGDCFLKHAPIAVGSF